MGIVEDIQALVDFAVLNQYGEDKEQKKLPKRVDNWLHSPSCPMAEEDEID